MSLFKLLFPPKVTPARVLLTIRNGTASDWKSICEAFGILLEDYSNQVLLRRTLEDLRSAELIMFSYEDRFNFNIKGNIEVSPRWEKIQMALGISLTQLAMLEPSKSMTIYPFLGLPTAPATKSDVFVLMPFAEEFRPIYQDHIAKVAKALKLKISRADDFFTTHSIMFDIWNAICDSRIIVAECTNKNPNVFYEIGLAHTVGKKVVFITQNKDDIPFDVRHIRYITYEYTPRGMNEFEERLMHTIKGELSLE